MTGRIRVLTPENLDAKAAALVGTAGTSLRTAVQSAAGTSAPPPTGVTTATASTLMQRDANARTQVADPSASLDAANKQWVLSQTALNTPLTQKGAASGVATLDGSSFLTAAQVPQTLGRNLGTGTAFPAARRGDVFYHSGIACLFIYDGAIWCQNGKCTVATRTARDSLSSTWSASLPEGFLITQTDKGLIWRWNSQLGWMYAGWAGSDSRGPSSQPNTSSVAIYTSINYNLINNTTATVNNFTWTTSSTTLTEPAWITHAADGSFTIQDNCHITAHLHVFSDLTIAGRSDVSLGVPAGTLSFPGNRITDGAHRQSGYAGSGTIQQNITWSGQVKPGGIFVIYAYQYNSSAFASQYQFSLSFEISPT